jgi:hypothetical protein
MYSRLFAGRGSSKGDHRLTVPAAKRKFAPDWTQTFGRRLKTFMQITNRASEAAARVRQSQL